MNGRKWILNKKKIKIITIKDDIYRRPTPPLQTLLEMREYGRHRASNFHTSDEMADQSDLIALIEMKLKTNLIALIEMTLKANEVHIMNTL